MTFYQINENANQKRKHTQQENETKLKNSKDLKEDENLNTAKMTYYNIQSVHSNVLKLIHI